ncbi:MAG: hypothetical protein QOC65_1157 [Sphingomonadales bacterium]|nr:hypothetical protein [Sphingomonadales bacterium]
MRDGFPLRRSDGLTGRVLLLAVAALAAEAAAEMPPPARDSVPPARDGDVAIGQELAAARRANTLAAYDLFIARHPQHPLTVAAREERRRLARRLRQHR